MRQTFLALVLSMTACTVGQDIGGGGGDDGGGDDGATLPDAGPTSKVCSMPDSVADAGDLAALKAQQCNVPGTQGAQKYYRLSATLPGSTDVVQLELWDNRGPFAGGVVRTGTFPVDTSFATCGVCLRALGDKGLATQKEYFASAGSVEITAIGAGGAPIAAIITSATLAEVNPTTHAAVASGCSSSVTRVKVAGTVVATGGGGGGGGCPTTIGD
jgi:hypothetical protein